MTIARLIEARQGATVTCDAATRVGDAIALLAERRIGAMPVMDGDAVIGIFSERDVIHCLAAHGAGTADLLVRDAMTSPAITAEPATPVLSALALMTRRRIRHLPVMQDGRMVGFVSIGDLVKYRMERIESEAETLRTYIQSA